MSECVLFWFIKPLICLVVIVAAGGLVWFVYDKLDKPAKRKEGARDQVQIRMTSLETGAIAAFERDAELKKVVGAIAFRKDFGIDPNEIDYLGDNRFLFRCDGLCIRGYIEYMGDHLYAKGYRLAGRCRCCTGWVMDETTFSDLAGLGGAIRGKPILDMCEKCRSRPAHGEDKGNTL